jgi:hypothetical protein
MSTFFLFLGSRSISPPFIIFTVSLFILFDNIYCHECESLIITVSHIRGRSSLFVSSQTLQSSGDWTLTQTYLASGASGSILGFLPEMPRHYVKIGNAWNYLKKSYPCNRLRRPTGLWDVEAPIFSKQSAQRWGWGCQPYAPADLYL